MKKTKVILALIILGSLLIGYTVAQQLITKSLTSSVTISTVGNIAFTDTGGSPLTSLNYGTLDPEQHWTKTLYINNTGNAPLYLTAQRDDTITVILSAFKHLNGSDFQPATPKLLGVGEELGLKIEIWSTPDAMAGSYSPEFLFIGSDS